MIPRTPLASLLAVAAVAALATGCAADATVDAAPAYERVAPATIAPGDEIPVPADEVVLRITGDIATANVGEALELDMATLERIGLVSYEVDDQQAEGRVAAFTGVLLDDLLGVAGIGDDAATLSTLAVNDYEVEIPVAEAAELPVLVATMVDGERMGVDRFGPLRVIYPYHAFDLDPAAYDPRWIWQLVAIDVR